MENDFTPTNLVKYLAINIHENITWKQQISIAIKLNQANGILSKLRHFIDRKTLKSIYCPIFEPNLYYSSLVWAQNSNSVKRLFPPGMQRCSDVSVRSHIDRDVTDHAETSSRRCNRYVNETDLFETSLRGLIGTWKKLTYLRSPNDVPVDT